jgi:phosphoribosylformylglycinamidine cyclo-ligase
VERGDLIDGTRVRVGDRIVGLAASGLHANGYSLVRTVIGDAGLALDQPYQLQLRRALATVGDGRHLAVESRHELATLGDVLLEPTRIYARTVLGARARLRRRGLDLHGVAHITGGGLPGNLPRALPPGLAARVDPDRWLLPSVMRMVGALGRLDDVELRATFNGGIGMILVVPDDAPALDDLLAWLAAEGCPGTVIGAVISMAAPHGARYEEGELS